MYEQLLVWGFVTSDVGKFLSFISVFVDLSQRPDEACPLISFGHADLLQKDNTPHSMLNKELKKEEF